MGVMFLAMLKNRMAKAAGFCRVLDPRICRQAHAQTEKHSSLAAATAGGEQRSTAIIDFRVAQIGAYDSCVATVGSTFAAEDSAASRYPIWEYASSPRLPEALEFAAE
jgi:hypothetical protein